MEVDVDVVIFFSETDHVVGSVVANAIELCWINCWQCYFFW
jgi:hypothetical protein